MLLLGDPGLGKSELLRALARFTRLGIVLVGVSGTVATEPEASVSNASG